jgi:hypothetical protein
VKRLTPRELNFEIAVLRGFQNVRPSAIDRRHWCGDMNGHKGLATGDYVHVPGNVRRSLAKEMGLELPTDNVACASAVACQWYQWKTGKAVELVPESTPCCEECQRTAITN